MAVNLSRVTNAHIYAKNSERAAPRETVSMCLCTCTRSRCAILHVYIYYSALSCFAGAIAAAAATAPDARSSAASLCVPVYWFSSPASANVAASRCFFLAPSLFSANERPKSALQIVRSADPCADPTTDFRSAQRGTSDTCIESICFCCSAVPNFDRKEVGSQSRCSTREAQRPAGSPFRFLLGYNRALSHSSDSPPHRRSGHQLVNSVAEDY